MTRHCSELRSLEETLTRSKWNDICERGMRGLAFWTNGLFLDLVEKGRLDEAKVVFRINPGTW